MGRTRSTRCACGERDTGVGINGEWMCLSCFESALKRQAENIRQTRRLMDEMHMRLVRHQ